MILSARMARLATLSRTEPAHEETTVELDHTLDRHPQAALQDQTVARLDLLDRDELLTYERDRQKIATSASARKTSACSRPAST